MARRTIRSLAERIEDAGENRLLIPRRLFLSLFSLITLFFAGITVLWNGILLVYSILLCFPCGYVIFSTYTLWRRFYAPLTFWIVTAADAALCIAAAAILRTALF